jgi:hypothetical protein
MKENMKETRDKINEETRISIHNSESKQSSSSSQSSTTHTESTTSKTTGGKSAGTKLGQQSHEILIALTLCALLQMWV